jgi:hypothetical protein
MNDNSNRPRREEADWRVNVGVLVHGVDHERVARRAYEIYESRHRADGHADQDWFQAVSEYEARRESEPPTAFGPGAASSYADRTRIARR